MKKFRLELKDKEYFDLEITEKLLKQMIEGIVDNPDDIYTLEDLENNIALQLLDEEDCWSIAYCEEDKLYVLGLGKSSSVLLYFTNFMQGIKPDIDNFTEIK